MSVSDAPLNPSCESTIGAMTTAPRASIPFAATLIAWRLKRSMQMARPQ
jgi:hypothetical protein